MWLDALLQERDSRREKGGPRCGHCRHWSFFRDGVRRFGKCWWELNGLREEGNPACSWFWASDS